MNICLLRKSRILFILESGAIQDMIDIIEHSPVASIWMSHAQPVYLTYEDPETGELFSSTAPPLHPCLGLKQVQTLLILQKLAISMPMHQE